MNRQHSVRKALCCDVPTRTVNRCGCETAERSCNTDTVSSCCRNEYYTADSACGCANVSRTGTFDKEFALGISYVPVQEWKGIVCTETALKNGTVFEELMKPFTGCERRRIHG